MDTTQEELVAALARRLEGRRPHRTRRLDGLREDAPAVAREGETDGDVLVDLADAELIRLE